MLAQRGVDLMDDYEYCEIMLEAYRDVLSLVLKGWTREQLNEYLLEQISFHQKWKEES
jgi:predicted DNA-binding protein YlxM (UPF0122 family)